jgi:hypothetical protein
VLDSLFRMVSTSSRTGMPFESFAENVQPASSPSTTKMTLSRPCAGAAQESCFFLPRQSPAPTEHLFRQRPRMSGGVPSRTTGFACGVAEFLNVTDTFCDFAASAMPFRNTASPVSVKFGP